MFSLYKSTQSNDYRFIDRSIGEWFRISGTDVHVYKYLGTFDQTNPNLPPGQMGMKETKIQDKLFLENRDRCYSDETYILKGVYNLSDLEMDLRQFAAFIEADTVYLEFHLTSMVQQLGRKIMPGDVFRLPHQRDRDLLDQDSPAIDKFYMVEDASRSASGYSPTWLPHVWRVKCRPMKDSSEVRDILDRIDDMSPNSLKDLMSDHQKNMDINKEVYDAAREEWPAHGFEQRHIWIAPHGKGFGLPRIFTGTALKPDGASKLKNGTSFPETSEIGDYFLRTDIYPNALFIRDEHAWQQVKFDYRYHVVTSVPKMASFINNRETFKADDGTVQSVKQNIRKIVKPKADFE